MTIEERVNKALDAMGDDCYVFCCSEAESAYRDGFTDGATEQQKIDIEKAGYAHCKCCAFFNKNCKGQDKDCSDYKAFKQTMEE